MSEAWECRLPCLPDSDVGLSKTYLTRGHEPGDATEESSGVAILAPYPTRPVR